MPKIIIREVDNSSVETPSVTTNAVFIPGYAITGPINTPVYCETPEQFKKIFGSVPYTFRNDIAWSSASQSGASFADDFMPSGKIYKNDFEKSYIMANELLSMGLPVWYERVFDESNIIAWTSKSIIRNAPVTGSKGVNDPTITLTSSYPGLTSSKVSYTLESKDQAVNGVSCKYYILNVGQSKDSSLHLPEIEAISTKFTFIKELSDVFDTIHYYTEIDGSPDNSGLVQIKFDNIQSNTEFEDVPKSYLALPAGTSMNNDEFDLNTIYKAMYSVDSDLVESSIFDELEDRGEYVLKYITSGAYPVFEYKKTGSNVIADRMLKCASNRGDAIAIIDPTLKSDRDPMDVYKKIVAWASVPQFNTLNEDIFSYGTVFYPYGVHYAPSVQKDLIFSGAFSYLKALATSVNITNKNWLAVAGSERGKIQNLKAFSGKKVTTAMAEEMQPRDGVAINPIIDVKPYGKLIWGDNTLKNNALKGDLTATSFLNVRQLANDIKRTVYVAAKKLTFEQNDDILWVNFKSQITPLLDKMVSGNGLDSYEIKRVSTTKKATVVAKIILYVVEPVEDFDITVELRDSATTIVE